MKISCKETLFTYNVYHVVKAFFPEAEIEQGVDTGQEPLVKLELDGGSCFCILPADVRASAEAMEFANDRNAKVITVTDSVHSPMNLYSSCNLLARSDMVSIVDSLVAPLSVINALVVAMCLKRPEEVKSSLKDLEEAWNNYQVYLKDEINFIDEEPMLNYPLRRRDES